MSWCDKLQGLIKFFISGLNITASAWLGGCWVLACGDRDWLSGFFEGHPQRGAGGAKTPGDVFCGGDCFRATSRVFPRLWVKAATVSFGSTQTAGLHKKGTAGNLDLGWWTECYLERNKAIEGM